MHTEGYTDTPSHYIYCHPLLLVQCWGLQLNSQVVESNSYGINLISYSVEVHFHLIQTTACIAKGNYISTAFICPEVVDSQSKTPQVFLPLYPLCEINRTVPRFIHDLSQWNIHYVALHSLDVSDVNLDLTALLCQQISPEPLWTRHLSPSAKHRGN